MLSTVFTSSGWCCVYTLSTPCKPARQHNKLGKRPKHHARAFSPPTSFWALAKMFFVLNRSPVRFASLAMARRPLTMSWRKGVRH